MMKFSLLFFFLLFINGCEMDSFDVGDKEQYYSSIEKGNVLVEAIENYYKYHGRYPGTLNDLIPQFLASVSTPDTNDKSYIYLKLSNAAAYEGDAKYRLAFSISSSWLSVSKANSVFVYDSAKEYGMNTKEEVHFLVGEWAYVTIHRHNIGESGRVE